MIALSENILQNYSTIAMTNEDSNYPIENIFSTIGILYTKTTLTSTVITITFASKQKADMFCFAFSNILVYPVSTIVCVYKDLSGATIFTDNLTMGSHYIKKSYFTKLTTIRSITITITNSEGMAFYFGKIWIGEKVSLPDFQSKPIFGTGGFSGYQKTDDYAVTGQIKGLKKRWELNIPIIESEDIMEAINDYLESINNLPHFIDFYEDLTDKIYWCHYVMSEIMPVKQNDNNFKYRDIKLLIEEAI